MSNLNLPKMNFETLSAKLGTRARVTLGYKTYAERNNLAIDIIHHNTVIAELMPGMVYIPYTGYGTSTTSQRIHKVLVDTGAYIDSGYTLAIRQGVLSLVHYDKLNKPLAALSELDDLQWDLDTHTDTWHLAPSDAQKELLSA